jgi:hypothetical protein
VQMVLREGWTGSQAGNKNAAVVEGTTTAALL